MALFDLFRPIWKHSDPEKRKEAVSKLTDPTLLTTIATEDSVQFVRLAAVAALAGNTDALLVIVDSAEDPAVRRVSLERISDEDALLTVAMGAPTVLREQATNQIQSQTHLARIATENSDPSIRLEAIVRLEAQDTLREVARSESDPAARRQAVLRVTAPDLLGELARLDPHPDVRGAAVFGLEDPIVLAAIAQQDESADVRVSALGKLGDESALARIALGDAEAEVRLAAASRLNDQATLETVARADGDSEVRKAALARVTDQAALADLIRGESNPAVRTSAFRHLKEPALLADLALADPEESNRVFALNKLKDAAEIYRVAANTGDRRLQDRAVRALIACDRQGSPILPPNAGVMICTELGDQIGALLAELIDLEQSGNLLLGGAESKRHDSVIEKLQALPRSAATLLLPSLHGPVAASVARVLRDMAGPDVLQPLLKAAETGKNDVVAMVVLALGSVGGEDMRAEIIRLREKSRNSRVDDCARLALKRLDGAPVHTPRAPPAPTLKCACGCSEIHTVVGSHTRQDGIDYTLTSHTCSRCGSHWSVYDDD